MTLGTSGCANDQQEAEDEENAFAKGKGEINGQVLQQSEQDRPMKNPMTTVQTESIDGKSNKPLPVDTASIQSAQDPNFGDESDALEDERQVERKRQRKQISNSNNNFDDEASDLFLVNTQHCNNYSEEADINNNNNDLTSSLFEQNNPTGSEDCIMKVKCDATAPFENGAAPLQTMHHAPAHQNQSARQQQRSLMHQTAAAGAAPFVGDARHMSNEVQQHNLGGDCGDIEEPTISTTMAPTTSPQISNINSNINTSNQYKPARRAQLANRFVCYQCNQPITDRYLMKLFATTPTRPMMHQNKRTHDPMVVDESTTATLTGDFTCLTSDSKSAADENCLLFHELCLKCSICDEPLETSCYQHNEKFYCAHDYHR